MQDGVDHLASVIAGHLREWEPSPPFVELAVFATDDAALIAEAINSICRQVLGTRVRQGLFHQSSVGSVTAVLLEDGRAVVIKAHQPERSHALLAEIVRIQSYLAESGLFAPRILAGPVVLGQGFAIVEQFCDAGIAADAHEADVRRALAGGLSAIVKACDRLVPSTSLTPAFLASAHDTLWPKPHSKLFDFVATSEGVEWIDELASLAREQMAPAGRRVIGHSDWRQEHVRFIGDRPAVAFDWDSLCCELEPALLGFVANGFCADWSCADRRQAPSIEEARAFKSDYEEARGWRFSPDESRLCGAAFAYACAYTARCAYALGADERKTDGTFQHLAWSDRARLLDL